MKLGILERTIVMQLLPAESDYITYKIVTDLRNNLGFSEKEIKEFEITSVEGLMTWNPKKAKTKEVEIGAESTKIIKKALEELDKQGKINAQNALLYERFVLEESSV